MEASESVFKKIKNSAMKLIQKTREMLTKLFLKIEEKLNDNVLQKLSKNKNTKCKIEIPDVKGESRRAETVLSKLKRLLNDAKSKEKIPSVKHELNNMKDEVSKRKQLRKFNTIVAVSYGVIFTVLMGVRNYHKQKANELIKQCEAMFVQDYKEDLENIDISKDMMGITSDTLVILRYSMETWQMAVNDAIADLKKNMNDMSEEHYNMAVNNLKIEKEILAEKKKAYEKEKKKLEKNNKLK